MVGVGRFNEGQFTLAQYFLRHPGEEAALLAALTRFMSPVDAIVSYNGKSFDIPLLRTRYTLQGLTFPLENVAHFDLLALARRLWRDRLPSCNLSTIENQILGVFREDEEVPGYAIPELYTEYLRWGDAHPMAGIFYHNAIDILSLTSLFAHASDMLGTPFENQPDEAVDVAAIGKLYQSLGDPETAMVLFEQSLQADLPEDIYWNTLERAASILKRQGDFASAVKLWEKAAQAGRLNACEELAKVYEHRERDYPTAIKWTEHALTSLADSTLLPHQCLIWQHSLTHRLARLQRKLAG
ncbi:MAG: ribonuclease H-like domain-containing protein [Anaerolineales bacterium]|nr:ribonuclease H-like domain-containing protein [Anaerolineales bacterium]